LNIYLVGYRGTGKSSVAPILAKRLGGPWQAVDMDTIIEQRARKSIAEIFAKEKEEGFRRRERSLMAELRRKLFLVVSTGGGVVLSPENREILKEAVTVWLTASPKVIEERLAKDSTTRDRRPNLTATGGLAEIEAMLAKRAPLYEEVAMTTLSSEEHTPTEIAQLIMDEIKRGLTS
jgi:shikimate kinase